MEDEFLTRKEAAALIKRTPQSLAHMAHQGKGPKYIKFSYKKVLSRKSELLEWLGSYEVDPSEGGHKRHAADNR